MRAVTWLELGTCNLRGGLAVALVTLGGLAVALGGGLDLGH